MVYVINLVHRLLCMQVAAAAQPQDLGKRQRKKVSYNEAAQARDRTASTSDSEYKGSDGIEEDEDDDDEGDASGSGLEVEGAEGKKVRCWSCSSKDSADVIPSESAPEILSSTISVREGAWKNIFCGTCQPVCGCSPQTCPGKPHSLRGWYISLPFTCASAWS